MDLQYVNQPTNQPTNHLDRCSPSNARLNADRRLSTDCAKQLKLSMHCICHLIQLQKKKKQQHSSYQNTDFKFWSPNYGVAGTDRCNLRPATGHIDTGLLVLPLPSNHCRDGSKVTTPDRPHASHAVL